MKPLVFLTGGFYYVRMGKWVHRLSEVNEEKRTAICSHCGLVGIKPKQDGWRCKVAEDKWKHPQHQTDAIIGKESE